MKKIVSTLGIVCFVFTALFIVVKNTSENYFYQEKSATEIEEMIEKQGEVVVYVYSDSCSKCIYLKRSLEEKMFAEKIYGLNTGKEENMTFIKKYGIHSTPEFFVFEGEAVRKRLTGIKDAKEVIDFINK